MQHQNPDVVDARLEFLWDMPLVAWICPSEPDGGPGSVVEIMGVEAETAYRNPWASVGEVRDLSRNQLLRTGTATQAIPESFADWRLFQFALAERQENARRVAAISRWEAFNLGNKRVRELLAYRFRDSAKAAQMIADQREKLAAEIETRGDKRIFDPQGMAAQFMADIAQRGLSLDADSSVPPALQVFAAAGVELDDASLDLTFSQLMDRQVFLNRLRQVCELRHLPWPAVKTAVGHDRVPACLIADTMRTYSQDQPEHKGSDLNDGYLLSLAPYADVTFVDKRTLEGVTRGRRSVAAFDSLLKEIRKASTHQDIRDQLLQAAADSS